MLHSSNLVPLETLTHCTSTVLLDCLHHTLTQVMRLRGEVNALKKVTSANTTNSKSSIAMTSLATDYTASGASYAPVEVDDTEPDHDDIEAGVLVRSTSSARRDSEVSTHCACLCHRSRVHNTTACVHNFV
jgi:hypothetical protein